MPRIWCRKPTCGPGRPGDPGQIVGAHLAVPDRHQHLPDRAGGSAAPRPLPTRAGRASSIRPARSVGDEVPWLEPLPDPHDDAASPATSPVRTSRCGWRSSRLQHLSPRQRAVLVLRDVLQWKAAEVGAAIGASTAAVNRPAAAGAGPARRGRPQRGRSARRADSPKAQDLLARYIAAFEAYDIDTLVKLFTDEAIWRCRRSTAGTRA